jgi:hypothetical protein
MYVTVSFVMARLRWGFTFLLGNSSVKNNEKLKLVAQATALYLTGEDRVEVSGEGYEGVLFTNHEWKVIGGFSGQQFEAEMETEGDECKIRLRFLVSEQTLQQGQAHSVN